jgi:hypothetical protein
MILPVWFVAKFKNLYWPAAIIQKKPNASYSEGAKPQGFRRKQPGCFKGGSPAPLYFGLFQD